MKFLYEYRTSDNTRHNGEVNAVDRDAAFTALKKQGIKPSRLVEAPGVANKVLGKGKRWLAIACLCIACLGLGSVWVMTKEDLVEAQTITSAFEDTTRRQIIGDAAVIEKGIRSGWADVFADEGDRFLASFAVPGVPAGVRTASEQAIRRVLDVASEPCADDSLEVRQIKSMLKGMKAELRRYLRAGGTIVGYGQRLVERQEQELTYYYRVKKELESAAKVHMAESELERLWEDRNSRLRAMGIRLVQMPEEGGEK